ncbi:hypothetical protein BGZ80_002101 [Entomortierella chlamydospora]|uniref:Uncharacterized protein n=1 Tax=Entomortierella chlamydospora TaxID=101097 RepID=A0A9P6MQK2_9FUNG|nr:hypothetical protein BGZ79_008057 [Entomortierella chlamydospora]KAG0009750.1 hypothetical protein BGZ80_002101 [Entomortierella chlamydospora]
MTLPKSNEAPSSISNSPSAKAKHHEASREKLVIADPGSEPATEKLGASSDEETKESRDDASTEDQRQVEIEHEEVEETEEVDQDGEKEAALGHSDQESPFLEAEDIHQIPAPQFADLRTKGCYDLDVGLNTLTPTRPRIRGNPINLFRLGRPFTRSTRTEQNDLVLVELEDDNEDVPRTEEFEDKPSGLISENQSLDPVESPTYDDKDEEDTTERVGNVSDYGDNDYDDDGVIDRVDDEDDTISLPMTPSKPRRQVMLDLEGLTPSESGSPSTPNTPGSWLGRWKYNIMMSHSSMEPPKLAETDNEDQAADASSVLSFGVASPEQHRILATPTRKRTKLDLLLDHDATLDIENSDDESPDYEILVNPVQQGVKRRSGDGDDEYGYDYDDDEEDKREEEKEDENSGRLEQTENDLLAEKKQTKLPFERSPLAPVLHGQQLQISNLVFTPPSKRPSTDLRDLKPPRAPVFGIGRLPMYRPNGVSSSPSQRRTRPLSFYDVPS